MGTAPQAPPCEPQALDLTLALGVRLPCASSKPGPVTLHTKSPLGFRLVVGIKGIEIHYGEFSALRSYRQAKTLETGDRHRPPPKP